MIHFKDVSKEYNQHEKSLEHINLDISPGELVQLIGHSGAGKTTVMRIILGEEIPTKGEVIVGGKNLSKLSKSQLSKHRRTIGQIFQDYKLLPIKTVFENVAFAMEIAGKSDEDIAIDVPHMLRLVGMMDKAHRYPHQLSGGERQRVAIARAIVNHPDILMADEPTGNLDPKSTNEIIVLLEKIHELGTTVIVATHNMHVVNSLKNRVITLDDGKIISDKKLS